MVFFVLGYSTNKKGTQLLLTALMLMALLLTALFAYGITATANCLWQLILKR